MMKRIFVLLLCFVLLLGGCAQQPEDKPNTPTAPAFSVKTDYSNYEPPQHYNPAFGGIGVTDLTAGEDRGTIYPFVGTLYASEDSFVSSQRYYGFTDERGKVLVDPVYSSVEFLGDKEGGVWCMDKESAEETEDYAYSRSHCAIATADGSRVTDCRYNEVTVQEGLVFARELSEDYRICRYDIYDLQLELVTTSEELLSALPLDGMQLSYLSLTDGMLRFSMGSYTDENFWTETFYFTDLEGSVLLGPYRWAEDFAYGCAAVETDAEGWYYIDKEGQPLGGKYYEPAGDYVFENGISIVHERDEAYFTHAIDQTGEILLTVSPPKSLSIDGGCIALTQNDLNLTAYYSPEGELLYPDFHPFEETDDWAGFFSEEWEHLGDGLFYDEEAVRLLNIPDGKIYEDPFPHEYRPDDVDWMEEFSCFFVHYYIRKTDSFENYIYSAQLEKLITLPGGWCNPYKDPFTGEMYLCFEPYDEGTLQIFDKDLKLCLEMPWDERKYSYAIYNGRIMYQNELGCMCLDTEGNKIFDYPFVSNDG